MSTRADGGAAVGAIALLRQQSRTAQHVVRLNTDGVTHGESLVQPTPNGNCINWVVGHLLAVQHKMLDMLGQPAVLSADRLARYDRYSAPLRDGADAIDLDELLGAWSVSSERLDAGLAALDPASLASPAPFSPSDDPNETIGSLLTTLCWHQSYHVGQLGLLRRMAGKEGAIG